MVGFVVQFLEIRNALYQEKIFQMKIKMKKWKSTYDFFYLMFLKINEAKT